jgi:hypothetical protein
LIHRSNKISNAVRSPVDDDFFSLEDFLKQSDQGELEMRRALRDDDEEEDDEEEIDLFSPIGSLGKGLGDDEDERLEDLDTVAGMSLFETFNQGSICYLYV